MQLSNTETIQGREIVESYGVVHGSTVRAKHIGRDFMAGLKNILRMQESARARGFDAVFNVRLETSRLASSLSNGRGTAGTEILAFGTAVRRHNG